VKNSINIFKPWNLPAIQLWVYEALGGLTGRYPEKFVLRMSSILGRPGMKCQDIVAKHWADLNSYRTSASICDATAMWLWKCLEKSQARFIIEFGTGFSTLVIAAYALNKLKNEGRPVVVLSVENDEKWFESQRSVLVKLGFSNFVHLVHSPLEIQTHFGQQVVCYSGINEAILRLGFGPSNADFVFVDGPVGLQYGGAGRYGSILQSINLTKKGGVILVHDALRSEEFNSIQKFRRAYSSDFVCRGIVPLWYGLAVCNKTNTQV
jgi:predicted O-methyltransferase YrrM